MTALHLIRVPLETNSLARWAGERGWFDGTSGAVFDEGRALHHLLAEAFGPGALHSFRLLVAPRSAAGNLYAYSAMDAEALRAAAGIYALPDHLSVLPLGRLEGKPMPEDWRPGQRLGIDLRARPVRRLRRDLDTPLGRIGNGSEVDAFLLEALRRYPTAPGGMAEEGRSREAVYLEWLAERLDGAAALAREGSRLAQFRRARVARGNHGIEGPDATIHGTLIVSNPEKFSALLARGIGRHRAYGYGMVLLRPPGRPVPEC